MGVDIQKIIMILNHDAIDIKDRMMVLVFIDVDIQFLSKQLVGFRLHIGYDCLPGIIFFNPEQPYIDIPTRTMFRNRIVKAQAISLENHNMDTMPGKKTHQCYNRIFLLDILTLNLLDIERPSNLQCPIK